MNDFDTSAFSSLFKEAYRKCFGHSMTDPVTETESKLFSNKIFDQTGLVIGAKSIKNYSSFIISPANGKEENPSIATLDTLARYVLNAPYTDETQRKNKESHYPYWFQYKEQFHRTTKKPVKKGPSKAMVMLAIIPVVIIVAVLFLFQRNKEVAKEFTDDFSTVLEDSLINKGWFIKAKDDQYWIRRNKQPGYLTLFTLKGDNWPDSLNKPAIKNLLLRKNLSDCFSTEIHLSEFVPSQNWQQAGILLLEDTSFAGKSLRLSFVYNDFYGGFPQSKEIIIQAIISNGKDFDKPEEITHQLLYKLDSTNEELVKQNLRHSALRIEKNGTKFRLLFANGSLPNSAFKEILSRDIDMDPKFIGLFALRGFVDSAEIIPAHFDFFSYIPGECNK
ncbi:MAG TPA: hypothetical protein VI461_02925 [Chitinophagaceae bacterium]|nr:hypothetical protein [Chitinophagaceae bacterium]